MKNPFFARPAIVGGTVALAAWAAFGYPSPASPGGAPDHVILIVLDGLSHKSWDRADISSLRRLAKAGTVVEKVYLPPAAHPKEGAYARIHTCSIPNPIMMAGTIFIDERTEYLASRLYPGRKTAFVANSQAYETLTRGYHHLYQTDGADTEAGEAAAGFLEKYRPAFMRLHLQETGGAGYRVMIAPPGTAWKNDIWHPASPYRDSLEKADAVIGRLADRIAELGLADRTAMLVLGDHGQADTGWHPLELEDSSITTLVVSGPGVRSGVRVPYGELVDVVPTACRLLGVAPPATSQGRVLAEALVDWTGPAPPRPEIQKRLNEVFAEARAITAALAARLEKTRSPSRGERFSRFNALKAGFFGIDRFVEWPRFAGAGDLLGANEKALADLRALAVEAEADDRPDRRE